MYYSADKSMYYAGLSEKELLFEQTLLCKHQTVKDNGPG